MTNPSSDVQPELNIITDTIKLNTTSESIFLFGSYANGTIFNSDYYIYTVVPDYKIDQILIIMFTYDIKPNED